MRFALQLGPESFRSERVSEPTSDRDGFGGAAGLAGGETSARSPVGRRCKAVRDAGGAASCIAGPNRCPPEAETRGQIGVATNSVAVVSSELFISQRLHEPGQIACNDA